MSEKVKSTLLAAVITAVLCAGTVSARQLRASTDLTVCGGLCTPKLPCRIGCGCFFIGGVSPGRCISSGQ